VARLRASWKPDQIVGREEVETAGGRVVVVPYIEGYSTSQLIEKIARLSVKR